MRILDEYNNELSEKEVDLEKGYLKDDKIVKMKHKAKPAVKGSGHYEVVKEYENGGKDVEYIIDIEAQPAQEAWTEYEDIKRYVLFSEEELAQKQAEKEKEAEEANKQSTMEQQINDLQKQLNDLMALIAQMQK